MSRFTLRRLHLFVIAIALIASACSSSANITDTGSSSDDSELIDGSTDSDAATTPGSSADDAFATVPALDGPVDPEGIRQLVGSLTGLTVGEEQLTCLVDSADGDSQVTEMFNGAQTESFIFSPEAFTALGVSVHSCLTSDELAGSLILLAGGGDEDSVASFTTCANEQIGAEQTGDLAYVGLAALAVGFGVPEGAHDITIAAATECVPFEGLVNQLATAREQASGFTIEADRECISEGIDDDFIASFWAGAVTGIDTSADLEPLLVECSGEFESVPDDFEPFAGNGALAEFAAITRNGVYSEAPPMLIDTDIDYQALLTTTDGEILVDLFEESAPITVNSFVALARDGYYDETTFHRVIDGFMAQAGDPTGTGSGGPGFSFDDEESGLQSSIDRRGILAMANSGPDTNGSQFFITLGAAEWLDGLHTVFGEVLEGDDILGSIDIRDPASAATLGDSLISVEIIES